MPAVLVTGGTSGIGHATATGFVDAGASVTVTGTRASPADYETDLERFTYRRCEMTDPATVDAVIEALGQLDVLINNAGCQLPGRPRRMGAGNLRRRAHLEPRRPDAPHHRLPEPAGRQPIDGGASVINLASLAAFRSIPIVPGYGSAKAGMVALTRNLARHLGR